MKLENKMAGIFFILFVFMSHPAIFSINYNLGWGSMRYPGPVATTLQQTTLPVVPSRSCKYNDEVVCVGKGFGTGPDGRQWPNACQGDSGIFDFIACKLAVAII